MKKSKRPFTLFEIALCLSLLTLVGTLLTWQGKQMVDTHRFHSSINHLLTDLRRIQIVSLADRADIELTLTQGAKGYYYTVHTDELLPHFSSRQKRKLSGVSKITIGGKPATMPLTLTLYGNGQVAPNKKVLLHPKEDDRGGYILNLETPLYIEINKT